MQKSDPLLTIMPYSHSKGTTKLRHHFAIKTGTRNFSFLESLSSSSRKDFWSNLPAFEYINKVSGRKIGAQTIVTSTRSEQPAMLTQKFGQCKVVSLLSGPTWKWRFRLVGKNRNALVYPRFWGSLIRFLVERDLDREGELEISPRQVEVGKKVTLSLTISDPTLLKQTEAGLTAKVALKGRQLNEVLRFIRKSNKKNRFEASYIPSQDGRYEILLSANKTELKKDKNNFFEAVLPTKEFATMKINSEFLNQLAKSTGGDVLPVEKLETILTEIPEKKVTVNRVVHLDGWNNILFFLLFIGTLGIEWYLKRQFI